MTDEEKADKIILELLSRKGFYGWWREIDHETQKEIILEIKNIIN